MYILINKILIMDPKKRKIDEDLEKTIKLKEVAKLLSKKKNINSVIYSLYNNVNILKDQINEIDNELNKVCPHNWVIDYDSYGSSDHTPKICTHCEL